MKTSKWIVFSVLVAVAVVARWLPHPPNFSPVMALAIFGGILFKNKKLAIALPLTAMLVSDLVLGFSSVSWAVYLTMAIVGMLAWTSNSKQEGLPGVKRLAGLGLSSSLLFFVVSNFAVWAQTEMYAKSLEGLVACYVAAIPFFQYSLAGDAFYLTLFVGGYALAQRALLLEVEA